MMRSLLALAVLAVTVSAQVPRPSPSPAEALPPESGADPCGPGSFPDTWIHGAPDCNQSSELLQVHAYDERTYLIRQDKCITLQAPFVYLLLGQQRALLIDSGDTSDPDLFPLQAVVHRIVHQWTASQGISEYEIVIAHSHAHADHTQGDAQFAGQANAFVVGTALQDVRDFFGISDWPEQIVSLDLGDRVLDVIPTPGHSEESLSIYDRCSGLLFTGDTLLPGYLLVFQSELQYVDSIERLFEFSLDNPVTYVLGGHVEMTSTPGVPIAFPPASYEPGEHELQLGVEHLRELHFALQSMGLPLAMLQFDDFKLFP